MNKDINLEECPEIIISDSEIQALANISHKVNAEIIEHKQNNYFIMTIRYNKKDERIIIASKDYNTYKENSNNFFKKFIKFNGNIDLADVFRN